MTRPYSGQALDPARAAALGRLHQQLGEAIDDGEVVPCVHDDDPDKWISDEPDVQREAAAACYSCPLMVGACETYIRAHPERSGVWAGLTTSERNQK